jgi:two-component system response regulator YesN
VPKDKIIKVIHRAVEMINKEKEKRSQELLVREKLETVVPIIENGLINNMLFKEYYPEDIMNYKNLLGIKENYGYMIALVCGEQQEGSHMTNAVGAGVRVQNNYGMVRTLIKNSFPCIVGSVMANKIPVFVPRDVLKMEYEERIALIEKARALVRDLRKHVDIGFRIGIGSVCSLNQVMKSYNEALRALIHSTGTVAHVDDMAISCGYEENYPVECESAIFKFTETGDLNGAVMAANRYFDWMVSNYPEHIMDIRLKVLEFVFRSERIVYENGGMTYHFLSRQDYLPTLLEMQDSEEIRTWFVDKVGESCANMVNKKKERSASLIKKAKAFIVENYAKQISLDDVSREINVSPYYFCKVFKEETGVNFIDYLTNIRIEKAKELMLRSDLSIKEICGKIGYSDPNYFSRIFKKNMGVTPTEYKEGKIG